MYIKALVIEEEGKEIVSADENGVITYAEGYDAEKVMETLVKWGVAQIPAGPETANRFGWFISLENRAGKHSAQQ